MRFSVDPDRFSGAHQYTVVTSMIKPQSQLLERIVRGIAVDERLMETALEEAKTAAMEGEVPVGAVLSRGGEIIARDHNRCIQLNDPTAHAEILVIRRGGETIGNYRLGETTLYVTVEPCPMCVGAITQGRIGKLVYKLGMASKNFLMPSRRFVRSPTGYLRIVAITAATPISPSPTRIPGK